MLEIGRICIKTQGRDAMEYCVIIDEIDKNYVLVDGNTRRKKVNKIHLEPLNKVVDIKKGASTEEVLKVLEKEGIKIKKKSTKVEKKESKSKKE
jgi:large subunit ribosomal protein L14e